MARDESCLSTIGHITLGTKQTGAPSAGNPHAGCDVAGAGNGFTVWLLRHSQRKRGETARLDLRNTAPVLDPTGLRSQIMSGDTTFRNWVQPDARLALEATWRLYAWRTFPTSCMRRCANGLGGTGNLSLQTSRQCLNRTYPRLVSSRRGENLSFACDACGPFAPHLLVLFLRRKRCCARTGKGE